MGETRHLSTWKPEEDDEIRTHYPLRGGRWRGWADLLPGRSQQAIMSRAARLGVRSGRWSRDGLTPEEVSVMRDMEEGFPPSRIDERRFWVSGRAHDLVVSAWSKGYERP